MVHAGALTGGDDVSDREKMDGNYSTAGEEDVLPS